MIDKKLYWRETAADAFASFACFVLFSAFESIGTSIWLAELIQYVMVISRGIVTTL